jgi:hypothetical protein
MAETLSTSLGSPDSLPLVGYSFDQLKNYIFRQLGSSVWNVELPAQNVIDAINDALSLYSQARPRELFGSIRVSKSQFSYLADTLADPTIMAVVQVDFVDTVPAPTEIFYGNLISPAPIIRTGLDEYDMFLRWRKTWQRVTSVAAQWSFDEDRRVLMIYNPTERYHCGVICHAMHSDTSRLPLIGSTWIKEYALAKSRWQYGDLLMKYSGAIPGPIKDLQMDTSKRDRAQVEIDKLELKLKGMQLSYHNLSID